MSDDDEQPELAPSVVPELSSVVTPDLVPDVSAKDKRLAQLADARKSALIKKRKLSDDVLEANLKLDRLTSVLIRPPTESEPEEVQQPKRVRVTKVEEAITKIDESSNSSSWSTMIFRNVGLMALAGGSYYLQHVYAKPPIPVTKTTAKPIALGPVPSKPTMLPTVPRVPVGRSGFVL